MLFSFFLGRTVQIFHFIVRIKEHNIAVLFSALFSDCFEKILAKNSLSVFHFDTFFCYLKNEYNHEFVIKIFYFASFKNDIFCFEN